MQLNIGHDGKAVLKLRATERRNLEAGRRVSALISRHSEGKIQQLADSAEGALEALLLFITREPVTTREQPSDSTGK